MAKRISDLDTIVDEAIDLSQYLPIDDPTQTFKLNLLQLSDFLFTRHMETIYPVGSTLYRVDNVAPSAIGFPGTWTKVAENVTLATGLATGTDTGSVAGNNYPDVPLLSHSHTATTTASQAAHSHAVWQDAHSHGATQGSHTHTATQGNHTHTATQGTHSHSASQVAHSHTVSGASGSTREHCSDGCNEGSLVNMATQTTSSVTPAITVAAAGAGEITVGSTSAGAITVNTVSSGAISVANAQPAVHADSQAPAISSTTTIGASGVGSPTIDVQGLHLNGVLWIRTA